MWGSRPSRLRNVRMPQMGGMAMLDHLKRLKIDVPVIFMSGYCDFTADEIHSNQGVMLIDKPFTKQQITEVLQYYESPEVEMGNAS